MNNIKLNSIIINTALVSPTKHCIPEIIKLFENQIIMERRNKQVKATSQITFFVDLFFLNFVLVNGTFSVLICDKIWLIIIFSI
jgi:hypothetical protein